MSFEKVIYSKCIWYQGGPTIYTKKFGTLKFFVEFLCVLVVVVAVVPMGRRRKGERPRQKIIQFNFFLFDNHHEPILISIQSQSPIKYKPQSSRKIPTWNFILYFHPLFFILLFNNFYHPQLIDFSC